MAWGEAGTAYGESGLVGSAIQINMEAHKGPYVEDGNFMKGPSPLPCEFGGV